ncbi:MAG: hypothetical protein JW878_02720 [Methanomicrobia archaeon]|nr:hypothetical protein [Methanomicrobia archaeon]
MKKIEMVDHTRLEQLLMDGYVVVGPVLHLSRIRPEAIDKMGTKTLIMLRHPSTGHRVKMLTSDERAIERAKNQRHYQEEPIGTLVHIICVALRGRSLKHRVFHLDQLVTSLNGYSGWEFRLGDVVGTFEVDIRIESTDRAEAEKAVDSLQTLLDYLSVLLQVGFHIQHCHYALIPRFGPTILADPEETMLPLITTDEIDTTAATVSSDLTKATAGGLNKAYIGCTMPSRLSMLWAAVEHVFRVKPEQLLTNDEVENLLTYAEGIESLESNIERLEKLKKVYLDFDEETKDPKEEILEKIKETLLDPNRLSLINRNKRMAYAIAPIMDISVQDAYSKVRTASQLRGKHLHQLSTEDSEKLEASEEFLQEALLQYLAQQKETLKV